MTTHKKAPLAGEAAKSNSKIKYILAAQVEQIMFLFRLAPLTGLIVAVVTIGAAIIAGVAV